jgi:Family of unknown function (DUF6527)
MSDARVELDIEARNGSFGFKCPIKKWRCEGLIILGMSQLPHDPQGKNGGVAQWKWDGNKEAPTFSPSINCGGCGWHGFIEKGRCVNQQHQDEPEPS